MHTPILHMTDYKMYKNFFGCEEMRNLWSERAILKQWIDFEVYLAQAQAELGMISQEVADEITRTADLDMIGEENVDECYYTTTLNTVALIRPWKAK